MESQPTIVGKATVNAESTVNAKALAFRDDQLFVETEPRARY
jgi:hypothetical protein